MLVYNMRKKAKLAALLLSLCIFLFVCSHAYIKRFKQKNIPKQRVWRDRLQSTSMNEPPVLRFHARHSIKDLDIIKSPFLLKEMSRLLEHHSKPLLTIFTTWNSNPEKYLVHNLTSHNWMEFRPYVLPVVFTNDTSIAMACKVKGWEVRHVREAAAGGVPLLKYMYIDAMEHYDSVLYAYSNSDLLFTEGLLYTLYLIIVSIDINKPLFLAGRRTDVVNVTKEEGNSWTNIIKAARSRGKLHRDGSADYFITSRSFPWQNIAPVIIGRLVYDTYLIYYSRKAKFTVIDATETILAVHQITASGNYEGYRHKNATYNLNLLTQMYNHSLFRNGTLGCFNKYTHHKRGKIQISLRRTNKRCKLINM